MLRVDEEALDEDDDTLIMSYEGRPFTGIAVYRDRRFRGERQYQDGQLHGPSRGWYHSGSPAYELECAWGHVHGHLREWYENGQLMAEEIYEFGIRVAGRKWNQAGELIEEFRLGESDPTFLELLRRRQARSIPERE
jgi:hypothetical protein